MRAGVFHNGKLAVVDVADPRPESGQLPSPLIIKYITSLELLGLL
jgi:hypothetical protein